MGIKVRFPCQPLQLSIISLIVLDMTSPFFLLFPVHIAWLLHTMMIISLDTCCQLLFFLKYHWIDQLSNLLTVQYFNDKHSQYYSLLLICLKLHYSLFMFPRSYYLNYLTLPFNTWLFQYMGLLFQQWCWFLLLPPFTACLLLFWDLGQRVLLSCVKWNIFNIFLSYRKTIWLYPLYKQIP